MIFFEQVSKFVLSDVSIHIPEGISLGLIGSSGSGKTTFLKLACGLLEPAAGCIHTMGVIPGKKRRELGSRTGTFFIDIPFFREEDTVKGNFRNVKIIYRMGDDIFEKEYASLAERLDFRSFEKEPVKQLSLGQKRRAEIGALFLPRPKLLLLDEPSEGLDQTGKDSLRELLMERRAEGATLVISSHNMEEISDLCERVVLLDQGSLRYYGGRNEVDGITITMVATNFVLSLGLVAVFSVNDYYLPERFQNGSIATELLLPVNFHGRMLADNLGNALFQLLFHFVPALAVSVCFIGIAAPAGVSMLLLFLLSALFGYFVLWTISFAVQMLSFWLINVWSIMTIKNVFLNVLSGSVIPLWFMPDWMKGVIRFTPFPSIYFTPVQIYLGQLSFVEILRGFLIQTFWIAFLFGLGMILWKKGQKKLGVQGG